jgi:hypothetical protein
MKYQNGGVATAPWLVASLLVAAVLSAGMNIYQMRHKVLIVDCARPEQPTGLTVRPPVDPDKDTGMVHIFPNDDPMATCTFVDYICWIRI